jgi:hypothetical protein
MAQVTKEEAYTELKEKSVLVATAICGQAENPTVAELYATPKKAWQEQWETIPLVTLVEHHLQELQFHTRQNMPLRLLKRMIKDLTE